MSLQKAVLFLDYANINRSASDNGITIDYGHLLEYMAYGRLLLDAFCYVPIDPKAEHRLDAQVKNLRESGYFVTTKVGVPTKESYKCDFDVEMAIDMIKNAHLVRPDIVILASGDGDMIPVVSELRRMGIRTEVAAFMSSMSEALRVRASSFIDLEVYHAEYTQAYQSQYQEHGEQLADVTAGANGDIAISDEEVDIAIDILNDQGSTQYELAQHPGVFVSTSANSPRGAGFVQLRAIERPDEVYVLYSRI